MARQKRLEVEHAEGAQILTLYGDKSKQIEKDETIVKFPGGHVAVVRLADSSYWVHVAVNRDEFEGHGGPARVVDARLDIAGRHASDVHTGDFEHPGLYHLAVRVEPGTPSTIGYTISTYTYCVECGLCIAGHKHPITTLRSINNGTPCRACKRVYKDGEWIAGGAR